ncbi:UV-endonuclease UvdE [Massarina eburnea CBS 473.64]|uniref:UV-endonuclease UvdE n=1 Tax=Massarina eburnea CBS 473.64 TaxID=1395130 RepID=A0A6A6RQL6_9PLEO|nr:UV-endonuclease UvdE [Massarina eburnea CBS 473.64]
MLRFVPESVLGSPQVALLAHQRASPTCTRTLLACPPRLIMASKRKRLSGLAAVSTGPPSAALFRPTAVSLRDRVARAEPQPRRRQSSLRASPDGGESARELTGVGPALHVTTEDTAQQAHPGTSKRKEDPDQHVKVESAGDPENDEEPGEYGHQEEEAEDEDEEEAVSRPPPVNSDYLPLPWKGRLGYACLNTYLRNANPPVFSSRTCRIASILEHRHPLKDPSQPEHPTKNRPDKDQPADITRGQKYVEQFGLANARDVSKMLRWNDKYGIKFMRLSSEMFPFASHAEYGYQLAPFAAETLAEVGKVVAELGHRVTTHPGQFTQLGSPRKQVIDASFRDLDYHAEMLSLLNLPPQQDRDAVMILHLGGAFGDKPAALDRFRENYARLPQGVKNRLVLENDDVVWSVHELLPLCQELNIPFVLDYHHHNILFDDTKIREGTKDIMELHPQIIETWTKKGITPKMHYSEPCPGAITKRNRRRHSPRVMTLPPCPDGVDICIEAKDKEQAVFELMRTFKLPGFDTFSDIIPHVRQDENKPFKPKSKKAAKKGTKKTDEPEAVDAEEEIPPPPVPDNELGMGGPDGRVYWPLGMEHWLRPPKRVIKKKDTAAAATAATPTPAKKKRKTAAAAGTGGAGEAALNGEAAAPAKNPAPKRAAASARKKARKSVPTPSPSVDEDGERLTGLGGEDSRAGDDDAVVSRKRVPTAEAPRSARKRSGRVSKKVSYKEDDEAGIYSYYRLQYKYSLSIGDFPSRSSEMEWNGGYWTEARARRGEGEACLLLVTGGRTCDGGDYPSPSPSPSRTVHRHD